MPVCEGLDFADLPREEFWRIAAVKEISMVLSNQASLEEFTKDEVQEMLTHICVS